MIEEEARPRRFHPPRVYIKVIDMTTIELKIQGMHCEHCVRSVTRALRAVPGVTRVEVTLEPERARVVGQVDPAALVSAVRDEGYEASVLP